MTEEKDLPDVTEGDDEAYEITFTDSDGNALDITGWTMFVTVKESLKDADSDAVISIDVTNHDDAANGVSSWTFSASDTSGLDGTHFYDVQVKKDNGNIETVRKGEVVFNPGVTDRTS